jgi:AbrB family transcriptional regulator, transcriptional pleiotropic regulator of transition state genes
MVKRTGVARKVDQLGRVVLPAEVRRRFGIRPGDMIEIGIDSDAILLTKVEDRCVFCADAKELIEFSGKVVCRRCVNRLAAEKREGA